MSDDDTTVVDGKSLFQCERCERVPVLDLIETDPDHEDLDDATDSEGMLDRKYLGSHVYNILQWDGFREDEYHICGDCRAQVEWFLQPEVAEQFSAAQHKS